MTPEQIVDLLTTIAAFDRRTVGKGDVIAWHATLNDIRYEDALTVVIDHYRQSREWLMPADIRNAVRTLRNKRLEGMDRIQPPEDLTPWGGYIPWLRATRKAVADGELQLPEPPQLPTRHLHGIDSVFLDADAAT
jgi:hypothetical protein